MFLTVAVTGEMNILIADLSWSCVIQNEMRFLINNYCKSNDKDGWNMANIALMKLSPF